jgi:hypothetical protein
LGPEVGRMQARERNACKQCETRPDVGKVRLGAGNAGRCKQRAGNARATLTEAGTHLG